MSHARTAAPRLANAIRHRHDAETVDRLRGALNEARLRDAIERALNDAPPLTVQQREQLARLLTAP